MADFESVTVRGKTLEASRMWVGAQEFLIVAIPSDRDAATAEIHTQQAIEIVPGLRIQDKKSGKELKILSKPQGYCNLVEVQDIHHMQLSTHISEDEIRQNFRFVG
ncbi:hypothetical protein QUA56_33655 [Microcoleus sp. N3A4]|uniref:hypothetical protein n=1 Tax=Microcoleus sp. N3A4 TaxID=3055379 RepID=UPI002FD4F6DF